MKILTLAHSSWEWERLVKTARAEWVNNAKAIKIANQWQWHIHIAETIALIIISVWKEH